jgi:peptidoglycan/LPS O-acetylase OafA/YrhL
VLASFIYLMALDFGLLDNLLHLDNNSPTYLLKLYYFSFQLPGQLSYFIAGILIYKFSQNQTDNSLRYKYIFAVSVMILFIYVTSTFSLHSSFFVNNLFILFTVSTLFILLYQARPRGVKWIEWLGKISYSLYLWHMPLLFVMKKTSILNHLSMPVTILLFTFALLAISTMSYYLVEEGGFQLRRKFEAKFQKNITV